MRQGNVRARMAEGATRLLAVNGLEGTSFASVLALTDTPRGSVYHHFPGGKTELVHAALDVAAGRARSTMEATRGRPAVDVVGAFLEQWRQLLIRGKLQAGCAVVAVTVAGGDAELLDHAGMVFREWTAHLASLLVDGGVDSKRAKVLALCIIATTEGAVAMCRAQRDRTPFETVARELVELVGASTESKDTTRRTKASTTDPKRRRRSQSKSSA